MENNTSPEVWRDVAGYEGLYQVSNLGRVKSFKLDKNGRLMKGKHDKDGYIEISLRDENHITKYYRVHRIVAIAFIPNPKNLPKINHLDGDVQNNYVENLEWCDDSRNNHYRHVLNPLLFTGESHPHNKYTNEQVLKVYNLAWGGKYSHKEIAKICNVTPSDVHNIRYGISWASVTKHKFTHDSHKRLGENHHNSKLTNEQALEIYDLAWNSNFTQNEIGAKYHINRATVSMIKTGDTWSEVTHHKSI